MAVVAAFDELCAAQEEFLKLAHRHFSRQFSVASKAGVRFCNEI